ncbi:hypothetical protein D3C87_1688910 [compost metagenome]
MQRHRERRVQSIAGFVGIVGINNNRFAQLFRRTAKHREDQHARIVDILRQDKGLGAQAGAFR